MLRGVDREALDAVVQEWMIWLHQDVDGNGEYVKWCFNWNVQLFFLNGCTTNLYKSSNGQDDRKRDHQTIRKHCRSQAYAGQ
jgi:hypothetical protein